MKTNINHLWGQLIVEELIRNGVDYFCIAPGSRSTPLTYSVATNKKAKSIVHFDERGLGFHALGYASATKKPVAIITTSGTAVANLFPAIIEASKRKIPLIILTADRPPELRNTGAHQTIDQVKIFSDYVRFQTDLSTPTLEIKPEFVLTSIDQAVFRTKGELSGPVHINCMFREPLEPSVKQNIPSSYLNNIQRWFKNSSVFTQYSKTKGFLDSTEIINRINKIKSGIIAVGKLSSLEEESAVLKLSEKLGWPILADGVSGLRLGNQHKNIIHYFDQILLNKYIKFDGLIHFGGRITSKRFYKSLVDQNLNEYIMVLNHPLRNDPFHQVTLRVQSSVNVFCSAVTSKLRNRRSTPLLINLQKLNKQMDQKIEQVVFKDLDLNEAAAARLISQTIPKNFGLFMGNSLPIREIDFYASSEGESVPISANRGASGIDGTIATAIGYAQGLKKDVVLFLGDLSFLYDLNSLAMLKSINQKLVIIVPNNNGGGIFNFLPIAQEKQIFEQYFATPHNLELSSAASLFHLNYFNPQTLEDFKSTLNIAYKETQSVIIEVKTNRFDNIKIQQGLN